MLGAQCMHAFGQHHGSWQQAGGRGSHGCSLQVVCGVKSLARQPYAWSSVPMALGRDSGLGTRHGRRPDQERPAKKLVGRIHNRSSQLFRKHRPKLLFHNTRALQQDWDANSETETCSTAGPQHQFTDHARFGEAQPNLKLVSGLN